MKTKFTNQTLTDAVRACQLLFYNLSMENGIDKHQPEIERVWDLVSALLQQPNPPLCSLPTEEGRAPSDTEMIDWLEKRNGVTICHWDDGIKLALSCVTPDEMGCLPEHTSVRSAITDAMGRAVDAAHDAAKGD
jgi:hypothetical protein